MPFVRDLGGEFRRLELLLDEESFLLEDLVSMGDVDTYWTKEILHISIDEPWIINWIDEKESLPLSLRIAPFDESELRLRIMPLKPPSCGGMADTRSFQENFSISVDSVIINRTKKEEGYKGESFRDHPWMTPIWLEFCDRFISDIALTTILHFDKCSWGSIVDYLDSINELPIFSLGTRKTRGR